MLNGMLFQDFAPAYLTDLKPYCNVFGCVLALGSMVIVLLAIKKVASMERSECAQQMCRAQSPWPLLFSIVSHCF